MSRTHSLLLAATLLAGGAGTLAYAQQAPQPAAPAQSASVDATQLPEVQGKVAQYSLTPRGDVDGLILQDGTQIHFPPHMSTALVYAVHPGDSVTVHGLRAKALPMVMARSITNDATHQTVTNIGPHHPRQAAAAATEVNGQIKSPLYGPRGEVNGLLLADGTEVRLPPPDAAKLGDALAAGKTVLVRGEAVDSPLGKMMLASAIGPDANSLTTIVQHSGKHGPKHGKHGHGPGSAGPDATDEAGQPGAPSATGPAIGPTGSPTPAPAQ